jgi:hypothetical protein
MILCNLHQRERENFSQPFFHRGGVLKYVSQDCTYQDHLAVEFGKPIRLIHGSRDLVLLIVVLGLIVIAGVVE